MTFKFAFKLLLGAFASIVMAIVIAIRAKNARRRQARIDAGEQCMHCNGREMERRERGVYCGECGKMTTWAILQAEGPSQAELANLYSSGPD